LLYIVATPIGNLEDITLRALRVLKEVDYIAAEDTRHTRKLLTHYDIKTRLVSFHEHSKEDKRDWILAELKDGRDIALVSDAGTPLISDPGAVLVREAIEQGLSVTSVPGPCAAIAAVTLSGIGGPFCFFGFLSKKAGERKRQIENLKNRPIPTVIYESPHALSATLKALCGEMGEQRHIVVAKELTKLHEQVFSGNLAEACQVFAENVKGEYVLVVDGCAEETAEVSDSEIAAAINECLSAGMTKKDAVKAASDKLGISKNRAYRLSL
jgi:16S rRNA (cytidine1402-2'-O)-methyltransferase